MREKLEIVGDQLANWAKDQSDDWKQDIFGRSAFNRYYYSAFLITRKMLEEFEKEWKNTPHSNIPDLLKNTVKKKFESTLKNSVKNRVMNDGQKCSLLALFKTSLFELANLLSEAYQIRIIADYEPETPVTVDRNNIYLSDHTLSSAKNWSKRADACCKALRKAWKDSGLG